MSLAGDATDIGLPMAMALVNEAIHRHRRAPIRKPSGSIASHRGCIAQATFASRQRSAAHRRTHMVNAFAASDLRISKGHSLGTMTVSNRGGLCTGDLRSECAA